MSTFELQTPDRPERCCATCRWWIASGGSMAAWCLIRRIDLPEALTAAVCISYDQEQHETEAVELFEQLRVE